MAWIENRIRKKTLLISKLLKKIRFKNRNRDGIASKKNKEYVKIAAGFYSNKKGEIAFTFFAPNLP
jgi:hypothetical protein